MVVTMDRGKTCDLLAKDGHVGNTVAAATMIAGLEVTP